MPELITQPSRVAAAGQPPKLIDEYVGRANTGQDGLSIAHMRSPSGWSEPGQRPEFDEFTIVLRGSLVVESDGDQVTTVQTGQGVHTRPGEWVRYSSPGADGAEYISVCVPAFAPDTVHRDA
jgi:mannose-6-phosphate isomerase-like protein (cupin superfamily)